MYPPVYAGLNHYALGFAHTQAPVLRIIFIVFKITEDVIIIDCLLVRVGIRTSTMSIYKAHLHKQYVYNRQNQHHALLFVKKTHSCVMRVPANGQSMQHQHSQLQSNPRS